MDWFDEPSICISLPECEYEGEDNEKFGLLIQPRNWFKFKGYRLDSGILILSFPIYGYEILIFEFLQSFHWGGLE